MEAVKLRNTVNRNNAIGIDGNNCPHFLQQGNQVNNLWLNGSIGELGNAFGENAGK